MTRPLRIAFSGASGTGKTTIAQAIAEKYRLPFCPVGSRSVAQAMGFANPYDVDAAGRREEFQRRLFIEKAQWEEDHESFVTDRSVLDNLAYTVLHSVDSLTDEDLELYEETANRYTHVFFCSILNFHHVSSNPIRRPSHAYHAIYESTLWSLHEWMRRGRSIPLRRLFQKPPRYRPGRIGALPESMYDALLQERMQIIDSILLLGATR